MNKLVKFDFQDKEVRTVYIDTNVWFVAKDVCDILRISNNRMAISRLETFEKGVSNIDTPGGNQQMTIISESGLYKLMFSSRKEEAKIFANWITTEVIPSIRKTGSYTITQPVNEEPISYLSEESVKVARNIKQIDITLADSYPELAQALIDLSVSKIISKEQKTLTGDNLKGIVQIAEELGYKIGDFSTISLGRFASKKLSHLRKTGKRLVNGQMRPVNCYPDNKEVQDVVLEFMNS